MNGLITTYAPPVPVLPMGLSVKTLKVSAKRISTRMDIRLYVKRGGRVLLPDFTDLQGDVTLLSLEGKPITTYTVMAEGTKCIGRLVNRSEYALCKFGIGITPMVWGATEGMFTLTTKWGLGRDYPYVINIIQRLLLRSCSVTAKIQNPLTTENLKRALGVYVDIKAGDTTAPQLLEWFNARELAHLEDVREAKVALREKLREIRYQKRLKQAKSERRKKRKKMGRPRKPRRRWWKKPEGWVEPPVPDKSESGK